MTARKKTASKKKRTPAQKRATARLVAMNKKKTASRRKTTARKKTAVRKVNPVRRKVAAKKKLTARSKTTPRKRNPDQYSGAVTRYVVAVKMVKGGYVFVSPNGHSTLSPKLAQLFNTQADAKEVARQVQVGGDRLGAYVAPIRIRYNNNDIVNM